MKIFFSGIFFLAAISYANCPTTDLLKNEVLQQRQDLGQTGMGWCCSYALTDALSLKSGFPISPVDVALSQFIFNNKLQGCFPLSEILTAIEKSNGVCSENDYVHSNSATNFLGLKMITMQNNLGDLTVLKRIYDFARRDPERFKELCSKSVKAPVPVFENLRNLRDVADVIIEASNTDFKIFLKNLMQKNCSDRKNISLAYEKIEFNSNSQNAQDQIFTAMQNNQSPIVSISVENIFNSEITFFEKIGSLISGEVPPHTKPLNSSGFKRSFVVNIQPEVVLQATNAA